MTALENLCTWDREDPATHEVFYPAEKQFLRYCEKHAHERARVWGTEDRVRVLVHDTESESWDE